MQPCTRLQCHFIPRHDIRRVHVCLDVTCHFWQNGRDFYVLLWQHEGETDTEMNPAEKVDPGVEISSAALVGIPTRDLSITSVALDPLSYHRSPPAVGALQSGVANTFFFFFCTCVQQMQCLEERGKYKNMRTTEHDAKHTRFKHMKGSKSDIY